MNRLALIASLLATAAQAEEPLVPSFVEETEASGVASSYDGGWEYMVGGGVAAFDCSGDGFPDLAFAGGESAASLWRNLSAQGGPLRFEKVESGIEMDGVTGTYPLDVDGDGVQDLMLLRQGESVLMRGLGACRFERADESWGFRAPDAWTSAFSATWEDGAEWPTLALGTYIDPKEEFFPWGTCTDNLLFRPEGRRFGGPLPLRPSYCALSMLFSDWDRSGTPALRIANDREYYKGGQEQMWRVPPGAVPSLYTEAEGWKYLRIWGMGIASRDLDGDGYPEYALSSMMDNKLQTLMRAPGDGAAPRPDYSDVAFPKGAIAQRPYTGGDVRPSTGWHVEFADVNNDTRPDLFIAKGNVDEMPDFAAQDPNNLLLLCDDGTFREAGLEAGIASMAVSRGGTLADLNLDGLPDLVVTNRRANAQLWRNATEGAGHWLELRLEQPGPNRDGVGAWIEVRLADGVHSREVTVGGGQAGGSMGWWHMGLGAAEEAEVRVVWPHGEAGEWETVRADGFYVLSPDAAARAWSPG
ncbi:Integrins alpha chain:ASPIC/UnbV [Rubellimicrobium mesophilum DSM 19309]|uniref:Integrins alpha chain:ASPIC/UnbV n=1 Tax=Rubellimicrobium mesophilum DSM 19309 TaxID=442562 RepID=A0A017HQU4_9RHOB|nr:CRTAC1 family protein [Rubellimicrobium mesophilum]EYD76690.1 Integrins alpha chain:ASPIC/UnbV [Rubellimicrobium mesophilum DSM 19309]